ncbi:MAG TPA: Gfo/Idh/MocA family oxidoreductase [Candidatus Saccharimonadales bacterium]|nr:Gfo/Idh/MocA family oxidoreductase [Candidatus Saccharimonadales bacterium]
MTTPRINSGFTVGVIGTGVGIRTHAVGFQSLPGVSVVGVVGTSVDRAKSHLSSAGIDPNLACSMEELLTRKPDLVCLTTPPGEREQYVGPLAATGSALLIEKPLATSLEIAQRIYEPLHADRNRLVFFDTQLRGLPAFQWLRGRIQEGELGSVYYIALRERTSAFRKDRIATWQEHQHTGGGQRLAMGPHLLDLGMYLADKAYEGADLGGDSCGGTMTPRGSWAKDVQPSEDLADEAFRGLVDVDGCWIDMFTTAIGVGPRIIEFDIEGTEGIARFTYRDGHGMLEVHGKSGHNKLWIVQDGQLSDEGAPSEGFNPSLFRIAFPSYAREIVETVQGHSSGTNLATFEDGMSNTAILDDLVARERAQ